MPPFIPSLYLSGDDLPAISAALARVLPGHLPSRVLDGAGERAGEDWVQVIGAADPMAVAEWTGDDPAVLLASVGATAGQGVSVTLPEPPRWAAEALELLRRCGPWEVATFPSYAQLWQAEFDEHTTSLGDGHPQHGWACAFRGPGHDRLVSRRWLTRDEWTVHRDEPTDTTLVHFHDPRLPPLEALSAARAGHQRLGRSDAGGWIPSQPVIPEGVHGLYEAAERSFKVVVMPGREVPERELLAVCQSRRLRRDTAQPIDRLSYVFFDPRQGAAMRDELWLREIECWVIDGAGERLLSGD